MIGFNLDRRLYDTLRCMPTVPGAIGAFRRTALRQIGGMIAASAIAIFLIPVTFYVMERIAAGRKQKASSPKVANPPAEPQPAVKM